MNAGPPIDIHYLKLILRQSNERNTSQNFENYVFNAVPHVILQEAFIVDSVVVCWPPCFTGAPRFCCATLDRSDQTIWVAPRWLGAKNMVWETLVSHDGLDKGCTTVCSVGKVWERFLTMVASRSDQRAKAHYIPIIGRTKIWKMVAGRYNFRLHGKRFFSKT